MALAQFDLPCAVYASSRSPLTVATTAASASSSSGSGGSARHFPSASASASEPEQEREIPAALQERMRRSAALREEVRSYQTVAEGTGLSSVLVSHARNAVSFVGYVSSQFVGQKVVDGAKWMDEDMLVQRLTRAMPSGPTDTEIRNAIADCSELFPDWLDVRAAESRGPTGRGAGTGSGSTAATKRIVRVAGKAPTADEIQAALAARTSRG